MLPTQRINISPDIDSQKAHASVFFETTKARKERIQAEGKRRQRWHIDHINHFQFS